MSFQGKKNIYTCEKCHEHIVTVDVDEGVTPFMIECKCTTGCKGMMQSSMYRVFDQIMKAGWEWYRPTDLTGLPKWTLDHVAKGGLILRQAPAPVQHLQVTDKVSVRDAINRFEQAVRANGYRTCSDQTQAEYDEARAALEAALSTPAPRQNLEVPEGWKLVPIEPTDAMLELPEDFYAGANRHQRGMIYKTMLNRAPPAPQTREGGSND